MKVIPLFNALGIMQMPCECDLFLSWRSKCQLCNNKSRKESWCGKHPCLPPAPSPQPSPSPRAAASIRKTANISLKLAFFFFFHISFNPELTPDLIDTAVTSVNVMENMVSGGNKMTWMLLLVAAPAFSGFNCM